MKKILLGLVVVILVVVAAGVWLVMTKGNEFVARSIETYGSAATGTTVTVRAVELSLTQGRGDVKGLRINNPPGYSSPFFLEVDDITLVLDLGSLRGRAPVVKEVLVDGAHLNAEQHGQATNLTDLEKRVEGASTAPKSDAPKTETPKDEGRIIVDRFRLTHGRVTLTSDHLKQPEDLELADVAVDGIGRASGGVTYDQAAEAMLDPILRATRNAVEGRLRQAAEDAARDKAEGALKDRLEKSLERN